MKTVRNLHTPYHADSKGCTGLVLVLRELLYMAGYTKDSDSGHATWAASEVLVEPGGANGFEVSAASPRQVYDPSGRFTQAMVDNENMLTLLATNDRNRSCWRMVEYIDANNVKIDTWGYHPDGWINETQMPARILEKDNTNFSNGSWILMDAPSGSDLQAYVEFESTTWVRIAVRPAGKAADPTSSAEIGFAHYYVNRMRIQAYADGPNMIFYARDQDSKFYFGGFGELTNLTDTQDSDPGFVTGLNDFSTNSHLAPFYMINHSGSQITGYQDSIKRGSADSHTTRFYSNYSHRTINNGKGPIRRPNVVMDGTSGGYPRGKTPAMILQTHQEYDSERYLDASGAYYHYKAGLAIPRNGTDDHMIVLPTPS